MNATIQDPALMIRTLWVFSYRLWEARTVGAASNYGDRPMPRWDGGTDASGRRHSPIWPKIAEYCQSTRLDPRKLVLAYFVGQPGGSQPLPSHLLGAAARKLYAFVDEKAEDWARCELKASADHLRSRAFVRMTTYGIDEEEACRRTLDNASEPLTPLFRYCVAARGGQEEFASQFAEAAFLQYLINHKAYNVAWGDLIPASFRERVLRDGGPFA